MNCFSIDLDGTLLNSQHEISEGNSIALRELQKNGYEVIVNTGRAYKDVIKFKSLRDMNIPIFCMNGSILYSKSREVFFEATIPISVYEVIFSVLKKIGVGILVYTNYGNFPSSLPDLRQKSKEEQDILFREYNYDSILNRENLKVYKLIALVDYSQLKKIEEVKKALISMLDISIASSFPNNLEITSNEAQKGKALLRYQQKMNLTFDKIYAIGDGDNDLSQFDVATTSIAMGNAPSHIQRVADFVTKNNDEDGFSYAVEYLLQLSSMNLNYNPL
ncbi:HAD family hydrolase [Oceanobacillus polygoni]|uniref:Cof subfamily protein (Haloacid dehalogenase superfamily) n=2 Tax=Oceanobacillus polygoni TaxID=1235259 RepID=A0A9X0YWT3_9BACI|nr:HAD family hydrolase [Oceanobacillus polygoni]MBP2078466.1 Cof subfamily protein (haloacid dehalogenase superfamily) [Oceanobacillus polygoni]